MVLERCAPASLCKELAYELAEQRRGVLEHILFEIDCRTSCAFGDNSILSTRHPSGVPWLAFNPWLLHEGTLILDVLCRPDRSERGYADLAGPDLEWRYQEYFKRVAESRTAEEQAIR